MASAISLSSSFTRISRTHLPCLSLPNPKHFRNNFAIFAKKRSGLEEALRIMRKREMQKGITPDSRIPPLRRGEVSPRLMVPDEIMKPPYVGSELLPELSTEHQFHDEEGIARMRDAGELAARVLDFAGTLVRPSVTTDEIDKAVHRMIIDAGAYPSPLGYGGFPKSVCTSVNECMCHGIPDSRQLQDGDIINIDVTVYLNGYHGDTSKTFLCGNVNDATKRLVKVTEECLERAISLCKDGVNFKKIGKRISEHAEKFGYNVVERFVGHGVGNVFHSEPIIIHHRNEKSGTMLEGQTFTIVEWWITFGSEVPALQRFAKRVLGLTSAASPCERIWSTFDNIHTKKRNCLEHDRMRDLAYIQYNRRLKKRYEERISGKEIDPIVLKSFDECAEWLVPDDARDDIVLGTDMTYGVLEDAEDGFDDPPLTRTSRTNTASHCSQEVTSSSRSTTRHLQDSSDDDDYDVDANYGMGDGDDDGIDSGSDEDI